MPLLCFFSDIVALRENLSREFWILGVKFPLCIRDFMLVDKKTRAENRNKSATVRAWGSDYVKKSSIISSIWNSLKFAAFISLIS